MGVFKKKTVEYRTSVTNSWPGMSKTRDAQTQTEPFTVKPLQLQLNLTLQDEKDFRYMSTLLECYNRD